MFATPGAADHVIRAGGLGEWLGMTTFRSLLGPALDHPARFFVAGLLIVAGAAHIPVTPEHLHEAPYIGALFIALTVGCFALALLLVGADTRLAYGAASIVAFLAVAAYVVSRSTALPQIGDDVGNWLEPLGVVSIVTEGAACLLSVSVIAARRPTAGGRFGAPTLSA
ncbi:MAG TPA: hypothetical protein VG708_07165 [Mycobacteriales bacterium]|nr:hypothetical protein [Mycobacteriales bacterium]